MIQTQEGHGGDVMAGEGCCGHRKATALMYYKGDSSDVALRRVMTVGK